MILRYFIGLYFISISFLTSAQEYSKIGIHDFNFDWEFKLTYNTSHRDNAMYKEWTKIRLPHDWSIHFPYDSIAGEGATGYLPGGIGVYQKSFPISINKNITTYLLFDGVYNNSKVYVNNKLLGYHPYGYSPFYFDITDHLFEPNQKNIVKVEVDRTKYVDSRWYTGSGIYRNVKLIRKNKLHIPIWGVFVTTPKITEKESIVYIQSEIKNKYQKDQQFKIKTLVYNDKGDLITQKIQSRHLSKNSNGIINDSLTIANPYLWNIESPRMYSLEIQILKEGKVIDKNEVKFGVRSLKFDPNTGFYLNGINTPIKGVCLHHDGGLVGAAVPKEVWKRRLQKLKKAGCNAIRIAHNPGSQEFLELCDEMGFLVQDEFFDEWDNPKDKRLNQNEQIVDSISRGYTQHFQKWAEKDLKNVVLAHRNHPSIFQWSIGNEIEWTYPRNQQATGFFNNMHWSGNYFWSEPPYSTEKIKNLLDSLPKGTYDIGKTAKKLAHWTRELDTTRYITANCILPSSSHLSGYTDALDVIGYSYRRILYDYGHKNYPNKPIMGTENLVQWHEWKAVTERPFISGTFLWTGIDYLGESHKQWPRKATPSGMLDVAGFEKPSYHMMKSLWNKEPHIFVATQSLDASIFIEDPKIKTPVERKKGGWKKALWIWHNVNEHWNYNINEKVVVEAYSNLEEIELYLNEKHITTKKLKDFEDHIYKWIIPYQKGTLKLIGKKNGKIQTIKELSTTNTLHHINLTTDKTMLNANGYSIAHIVAQLQDKNRNPIKNLDKEVTFEVKGEVEILGVDNGSAYSVQSHQTNTVNTNQGKCLLIIRSKKKESTIEIKASTEKISSNIINIKID